MFTEITEVPKALLYFYHEEVRTDQVFEEDGITPVYAQEEYTYLDENGEEQAGTKQVKIFQEVSYAVLNIRPQGVAWDKVQSLIAQGKNDSVISKFVDLAVETEKWSFYDDYVFYLEECEATKLYNETEQLDEDGEVIDFPQREMPLEPTIAESGQVLAVNAALAKQTRDLGQVAVVAALGMEFDADTNSHTKMLSTLTSWDALAADPTLVGSGAFRDGKLAWTLADNTKVLLTKAEVQEVLDAIAVRGALLHLEYTQTKEV